MSMSKGLTPEQVRALTGALGMRANRGALPANGRADGRTDYMRNYKRAMRVKQKKP